MADLTAALAAAAADPEVWVAPGLIDLQVNGYAGHDVNAPDVSADDVVALVRAEWAAGVTAFCPTIITAPEDRILTALRAIAAARAADPLVARTIPAVHVEGPHLAAADGPRGAHDARYLRPPDPAEFDRWQDAAGGLVGIVTLAPELPGAAAYIRHLTAAGTIAAIGHTDATPADVAAAVHAGARMSTHLGNGTHAVLPRHPNHLWAQLAQDALTAGLIGDGQHLDDDTFAVLLRAKGIERCVLVSDTVALAGMAPGRYRTPVGGDVELTADGRLTLPGTPLLAGATATLAECVRRLLAVGLTRSDLAALASTNPARLLGRTGHGAPTDATVFRAGAVMATVVAGQVVAGALP